MREPMIISNPLERRSFGQRTTSLASTLDVMPTLLEWFNITYPSYHLFNRPKMKVKLTGKSLLPLTESFDKTKIENVEPSGKTRLLFGSQSLHEITMDYPMRMVRSDRFKLIRFKHLLSTAQFLNTILVDSKK